MPEIGTSGSMSENGKRGVAKRPKPPRPFSTLPPPTSIDTTQVTLLNAKATSVGIRSYREKFRCRYDRRDR